MSNVIYADPNVSSAELLFGRPSKNVLTQIKENVDRYVAETRFNRPDFAEYVQNTFNRYTNTNALRYVEAVRNKLTYNWGNDTIRRLNTIEEIQQAKPVMQRWVMAHPEVRRHYHEGGISAYEGKYSYETKDWGRDVRDYRAVTNGIIMTDSMGHTFSTEYIESDSVVDLLTLVEKANILGTWTELDKLFASGDNTDPTSSWNETL